MEAGLAEPDAPEADEEAVKTPKAKIPAKSHKG
jgi:hypothetical protein